MRQTELHLTDEDRELIESYRAKGLHHAREVNRAHILSALDRGIPEAQIMEVLGVGRTAIWRTRGAYLEGGVEYAVCDVARSGKPREYDTDVEAQITALACSEPPEGAKRWTLELLEQEAQKQADIGQISRIQWLLPFPLLSYMVLSHGLRDIYILDMLLRNIPRHLIHEQRGIERVFIGQ